MKSLHHPTCSANNQYLCPAFRNRQLETSPLLRHPPLRYEVPGGCGRRTELVHDVSRKVGKDSIPSSFANIIGLTILGQVEISVENRCHLIVGSIETSANFRDPN